MTVEAKARFEVILMGIQGVMRLASVIPLADARWVVEQIRTSEDAAVYLDPTFWMRHRRGIYSTLRALEAFVAFRERLPDDRAVGTRT